MILEFKFTYVSNNNYLQNILENIIKRKNIDYVIFRKDETIYLYLEDEEKRLLEVSDMVSQELPMSIFLKNFTLEVVSEIPQFKNNATLIENRGSYCPNCTAITLEQESTLYYNPFIDCEICGTTCDVKNIKFLNNEKEITISSYKKLFEELALLISNNKVLKLKTTRGDLILSKLENLDNTDEILNCNINNLTKIVVNSKEKSSALLCVEKPFVDFYVNSTYKKNNNVKKDKISVICAYDLILYLLTKELEKYNIDFLAINENINYDYEFTFETDAKLLKSPKIVLNKEKSFIMENEKFLNDLNTIYKTFDDKSKGQFMVLIEENKLHNSSILNLYLSSKYATNVSLYSNKIDGIIDILNFQIPNSIAQVFEEIEKDEKGKRLLNNYIEKFNSDYKKALDFDLSKLSVNSILSLWKIVSKILGIGDILNLASASLLKKGPRLDYKLKSSKKIFNREFDLLKLIQSGMSFKLAGVDDKTIAFGYVESYIEFLANLGDEVNSEFSLDGISLSGDLIANDIVYDLLKKYITKNFKLYYNKDFPIQL